MTTAPTASGGSPPFWHAALFHDGEDELIDVAVPYVREGLDLGDAAAVALPSTQLENVRTALGRDADHVLFVDISVLGRNPSRVLPEIGSFRRAQGVHRRVRAFGTPVWAGRSEMELAACHEHDALLNVALADAPVSVLCPFDRTVLERATLERARTTHPLVCEDGWWSPSDGFGDQGALVDAARGPLPDPEEVGETLVYRAPTGPRAVRLAVAEHAHRAGLGEDQVADLCLAVHEAAVNTVVHTDGPGILSLWSEGDAVVCQIEDSGWIRDTLVGRHPPDPADGRGYGLFLVNQLCDFVQVRSGPEEGTVVRMRVHRREGTGE